MNAAENSRKCYNCKHFFTSYFCGYNSSNCKIYGSLDMDQKVRHPDTAAESCDQYEKREAETPREEQPHKHQKNPKCPKVEKLLLRHKGRDNWSRPVYEDETGRLWKDVEPRADREPKLCTALYNAFDGEPDIPLKAMERYKDARLIFEPERDTWTW